MPLVKLASHRLCGKGWTNDINTGHNHPSRIKSVSDNRNVGFHIAGIVVSANKNIHETLLTNEEYAKAIDLGGFYRVPADNRGLNYDKYFREGNAGRNTLTEFNSNNTKLLNKEGIEAKMMELTYIQKRLSEE